MVTRRQFMALGAVAGLCMAVPLARASGQLADGGKSLLLGAWQLASGQHQAGVLQVPAGPTDLPQVQWAIDLPTRPHGLMHLQGDEYLVIARRPGDWMLRLNTSTGQGTRIWQDADHHLNGHSAVLGNRVYTTETDLLTGLGAIAVRDKTTLELIDVWATQGHDPHEVLAMPQGALGIQEPFLLVANGGIQTHADMGRTQLNYLPMDSSLVALNPYTGAVLKKWTLQDERLSLRHLALHRSGVVGVALQAHHQGEVQQHSAPVFALLNHQGLQLVPASTGVKGYAGDIAATPKGFVISCTKQHVALYFSVQGQLQHTVQAKSVCALAAKGDQVWLGQASQQSTPAIELDNHWLLL